MEPHFHLGDLVLVRRQSSYQVGDAVIYRNAQLGRLVFHRIAAMDQDHFVIKGDNNSWVDAYEPVQSEILGKLWIYFPGVGKGVEWVRSPVNLAIVIVLFGGLMMAGMFLNPTHRTKRNHSPSGNLDGTMEGLLYVVGFFAVLFLGLCIFAFTRPTTLPADKIQYQQEGFFYYSATGAPGVYDSNIVQPGEPVFPKLTCFLNVGFAYSLLGNGLQNISGNHLLSARILEEQSGWQRTLPLESETSFSGNTYFSMSTLDLCQVENIVNSVEQQTGLHASVYTLELIPHIMVTSNVAGQAINDSFDPTLTFKFDKVHFFLDTSNVPTQGDVLHVTKQGFAPNPNVQANTLSLLGLNLSVQAVRAIALIGFMISFGGLLVLAWIVFSTVQQNQEALIRLKYGNMLMDIYEHMLEPTTRIVDVASIDDLAKLAERQSTMILHMTLNFLQYYMVQSNNVTYRYVVSTGKKGIPEIKPTSQPLLRSGTGVQENEIIETELISEDIFRYKLQETQPRRVPPPDTQVLRRFKI